MGADALARHAASGLGGTHQGGWLVMRRVARASFVVVLLLVASVGAQQDIQILSKDDAAQVFALSKAQWRENLVAVVKSGLGTRAGDALTAKAPKGIVITLPIYSQTDA